MPNPDIRDRDGRTPLMLAAAHARAEVCQILLDAGATVDLRDDADRSALDHALAAGAAECAALLRASASSDDDLLNGAGWEVDDDATAPEADVALTRSAAETQAALAMFEASSLDSDWSDVLVEVPTPPRDARRSKARQRLTVRFYRRRDGEGATRDELPADLTGDADDVLAALNVGQIVHGSDASRVLKSAVTRSRAATQSGLDFLCDDEAEEKLLADGLTIADWFELSDIMTAFTVLLHRLRPTQAGARMMAAGEGRRAEAAVSASPAETPDEILHRATLAQIVLNGNASAALRKAMARAGHGSMTVDAFLVEDDPETLFRGALTSSELIELTDLVNAFTTLVFRQQRGH